MYCHSSRKRKERNQPLHPGCTSVYRDRFYKAIIFHFFGGLFSRDHESNPVADFNLVLKRSPIVPGGSDQKGYQTFFLSIQYARGHDENLIARLTVYLVAAVSPLPSFHTFYRIISFRGFRLQLGTSRDVESNVKLTIVGWNWVILGRKRGPLRRMIIVKDWIYQTGN